MKIRLIIRVAYVPLRPASGAVGQHRSALGGGLFTGTSTGVLLYNDRQEDLYIASADWMGCNFFRRIETCVPIRDTKLKRRVIRACACICSITSTPGKCRVTAATSVRRNAAPRSAQAILLEEPAPTVR